MLRWPDASPDRLFAGAARARRIVAPAALALLAALTMGCAAEDEVVYTQFNAEDDTLSIAVGAPELQDDLVADLHSTTGEVIIGTATVTPGGGPIGTVHSIIVVIDDDYEGAVDRVSVRLDSGDRGEDEYDLDQDSADEGLYKLSLESVGEEGEQRDDLVTVRVWDEDQSDSTADTGS